MALASISSSRKTAIFDLNNGTVALGEVLVDFCGTDLRDLQSSLDGHVVFLNSHKVDVPGCFKTALHDNDFVSIYLMEIACHGVKGEGVLYRGRGFKIEMCCRDHHRRPHIHVNDHAASISLDGQFLAGSLPRKTRRLVKDCLETYRSQFEQNWENHLQGLLIKPIAPLE